MRIDGARLISAIIPYEEVCMSCDAPYSFSVSAIFSESRRDTVVSAPRLQGRPPTASDGAIHMPYVQGCAGFHHSGLRGDGVPDLLRAGAEPRLL